MRKPGRVGIGWLGGWIVAAALLAAGCHSRNKDRLGLGPPATPPFLNGPMAVLLTNSTGFSARVVMTTGTPPIPTQTITGELLCRGSELLFAPDPKSPAEKRFARAGFSFVWNVASQRGFLLSEALQGCAPISSQLHSTEVRPLPSRSVSERIEGHPCMRTEVEVQSSDGSKTPFRVWRASDLQEIPLRVATTAVGRSMVLNLSKVRIETPAARLFVPPDSFTRLDSAETVMAEMAMRQENLKRKVTEETPPGESAGPPRIGAGGPEQGPR
jgi:hypothetical protein